MLFTRDGKCTERGGDENSAKKKKKKKKEKNMQATANLLNNHCPPKGTKEEKREKKWYRVFTPNSKAFKRRPILLNVSRCVCVCVCIIAFPVGRPYPSKCMRAGGGGRERYFTPGEEID